MTACDRCGKVTDRLYPHTNTDEMGVEHDVKICWDCDFDIINGIAPYDEDQTDMYFRRLGELYNSDPVNYGHLARYAM